MVVDARHPVACIRVMPACNRYEYATKVRVEIAKPLCSSGTPYTGCPAEGAIDAHAVIGRPAELPLVNAQGERASSSLLIRHHHTCRADAGVWSSPEFCEIATPFHYQGCCVRCSTTPIYVLRGSAMYSLVLFLHFRRKISVGLLN